jgi:hypothetical protein
MVNRKMWNGLKPFHWTPLASMLRAAPFGVSMINRPPGSMHSAAAATNVSGDGTCSMTSIAVTSPNVSRSGSRAYCSIVPVNTSSPKRCVP